MEDEDGMVHRKYGSKPQGKQCAPVGTKLNTHCGRRMPKSSENTSRGRREPRTSGRHRYGPVEYNDVFGGPPKYVSARHADKPSAAVPKVYDEVFKVFRTELHLSSKGSAALPVFELPVYENSSLPVFELPVSGGFSLPVFDLPSWGEDLGSGGTWTKSSSDDFYDDIFGGSGGVSGSNKSSVSRPSRSRSKSSSSQQSSENLSPHHPPFSRMTGDHSSSASKLRQIDIFSKRDQSPVFAIPCQQRRGYTSQHSDAVSAVSSACSSPSRMSPPDPFSAHSSLFDKPQPFNNGKSGLKTDDVFGGFPRRGHFISLQSAVKPEEETVNRFEIGTTLGIVDQADISEDYSVLLNAPGNSPTEYGYDLKEQIDASVQTHQMGMGNASLAEKPVAHLVIPHMVAPTPLQSPPVPHRMKSWRGWASKVKESHFSQKRGSSSISSAGSSCISPTAVSGSRTEEKLEELRLEDLGRHSLDDGEGSDFHGSYVIEILSQRSKNFLSPDENVCHIEDSSMADASAIAMKEAIAWAKEKCQLGSWNEGQEVPTFVQRPKDDDAQVQAHEATQSDAGSERMLQDGSDADTNEEGRFQVMPLDNLPQGAFQRSENLAGVLTDRSEYRSESHDELFVCKKELEQPTREIKLRMSPLSDEYVSTDAQERVIKEVLDDVKISCKQHPMNPNDMGTFFNTPEIQDAYAMDAAFDTLTMVGLLNLWEEKPFHELERCNFDGQVVYYKSHQSEGNDAWSRMVKEIPEMRTQLELGRQQKENEHVVKALDCKKQTELEDKEEQFKMELNLLDYGIKRWSKGKEGNIRSLLSTLQYVLWPESGWKQIPLVDMIEEAAMKKAYQKAILCVHPDKLQQRGATMQQTYVAEKVLSILQKAWTTFNSEDNF